MPTSKQPRSHSAPPPKSGPKPSAPPPVAKGISSTITKEAVKSYADQHRAAMIRLADR